jgi:transcriptional regulator with XRE-family HTH domain
MENRLKLRKRWPKGAWMKLTSADTLKALMDQKGFNGERLGRYAGCSRQMISQLRNGSKKTCSPELATRIVEALQVPLDVLFEVSLPSKTRQRVNRREAA